MLQLAEYDPVKWLQQPHNCVQCIDYLLSFPLHFSLAYNAHTPLLHIMSHFHNALLHILNIAIPFTMLYCTYCLLLYSSHFSAHTACCNTLPHFFTAHIAPCEIIYMRFFHILNTAIPFTMLFIKYLMLWYILLHLPPSVMLFTLLFRTSQIASN